MHEPLWRFFLGGTERPPVPERILLRLLRMNCLPRGSMVWRPGLGGWKPANTLPELQVQPPVAPGVAPSDMVLLWPEWFAAAAEDPYANMMLPGAAGPVDAVALTQMMFTVAYLANVQAGALELGINPADPVPFYARPGKQVADWPEHSLENRVMLYAYLEYVPSDAANDIMYEDDPQAYQDVRLLCQNWLSVRSQLAAPYADMARMQPVEPVRSMLGAAWQMQPQNYSELAREIQAGLGFRVR